MGRGLQQLNIVIPVARVQGVFSKLAAAEQVLRLQRGQHTAAGGRIPLSQRKNWLHDTTRCRISLAARLSLRSGVQGVPLHPVHPPQLGSLLHPGAVRNSNWP